MTPSERNAIRELLETKLQALHDDLHHSAAELNQRLSRIEEQTTRHNGRMTRLEERHIHDETLRVERERVAEEEAEEDTDTRRRWKGIVPAAIAGAASGVVILAVTTFTNSPH